MYSVHVQSTCYYCTSTVVEYKVYLVCFSCVSLFSLFFFIFSIIIFLVVSVGVLNSNNKHSPLFSPKNVSFFAKRISQLKGFCAAQIDACSKIRFAVAVGYFDSKLHCDDGRLLLR
jgi:hypothetical protein